ncbi:MAG: glycosyltransferase family 4 protein [Chloroflexi bacterium]|nr:glycosyltransferase family 4 protein [Chloroflexota bacterium]
MRIAMMHIDLPWESTGGVANQVHQLADELVGRGHSVTMFTLSPSCPEARYRVEQLRLPAYLRRRKGLLPFVVAFLFARQDLSPFDVVHAHGDNYLCLHRPAPMVRTFYGSALDEARSSATVRRSLSQCVQYPLEWIGGWAADWTVGISEATRRALPFIREVIPCGVNLERFRPGAESDRSRYPSILFVGSLQGRKRGDLLRRAFLETVLPAMPDAELWMVCPERAEGPHVVSYSRVPQDLLVDLYRRAWVFCLPSSYEGFGVPYVEAMASGTPVVATPNAGAREVLDGGAFGRICGDRALGEALVGLLADPSQRRELADRGHARVQRFGWDRVVPRYEAIYQSLVARAPAAGN